MNNKLAVLLIVLSIASICTLERGLKKQIKRKPITHITPNHLVHSNDDQLLQETRTKHMLNKYYLGCPLKEGGYFWARGQGFFAVFWRTIASCALYECNIKDKLVTKTMIVRIAYQITGEEFTRNMFAAIASSPKIKEEQKQRIKDFFRPLSMDLVVGKELVMRFDNNQLTLHYDNKLESTLQNSRVKEFDTIRDFIKTDKDYVKTVDGVK